MTRIEFLNGVIGLPWEANARGPLAFDCYHLFAHAQRALGLRSVATIEVPPEPSWAWLMAVIANHPERSRWLEVPSGAMSLVRAGDLSAVLMARVNRPAHVGTWFLAESRVLHTDQDYGVCFDTLADLRVKAWSRLRFFEPIA